MSNLSIIENITNDKLQVEKHNQLNVVLNTNPPKEWLKTSPFVGKGKVPYLPIERIEWLLKRIFKQFKVEVRQTQQIFNGIVVTVRIHYIDPITGEWMYHDGIGAAEIQTKKGASAADMSAINSNAIALCAPKAQSEALKKAAKNFGRLFGSDLTREGKMDYDTMAKLTPNHPNWKKAVKAVKSGKVGIDDIEGKYGLMDDETREEFLKQSK